MTTRLTKLNRLAALVLACFVSASASATTIFTGASFFRADSTGNNINGFGGILHQGGWTTVLGQENVPGNKVYSFWISQSATPSPANFITPSAALSVPLVEGGNTFYFWADNDDLLGGANTFGLNLFFNGAGATSPSASGYVIPGAGQVVHPNSAPNTPGLNMVYGPGTGTLSFVSGSQLITLSSFVVLGLGGNSAGPGSMDLVNPYTPPAAPNGVTDTYGYFTLTATTIPEPGTLSLLALTAAGALLKRRNKLS